MQIESSVAWFCFPVLSVKLKLKEWQVSILSFEIIHALKVYDHDLKKIIYLYDIIQEFQMTTSTHAMLAYWNSKFVYVHTRITITEH